MPATFFLTGAGLTGRREFWWQTIERAWNAGLLQAAQLARLGLPPAASLRDAAAAVQALPPGDRRELVASAIQELCPPGPEDRLLDAGGIAALAGRFEIGFHTLEHDDLRTLDGDALADAMVRGRTELEALVGPMATIAYPHGGADERVAHAARAAGFSAGFRSSGGAACAGDDPFLLPRDYPARGSALAAAAPYAGLCAAPAGPTEPIASRTRVCADRQLNGADRSDVAEPGARRSYIRRRAGFRGWHVGGEPPMATVWAPRRHGLCHDRGRLHRRRC